MKVSIITTFYNSVTLGDFVHRSMKCLLNQTYRDIEFICINDGSKDETHIQLKEYADLDQRIIVIDKKNEGVAQYAKAAGQDIASGDFVMLFDHDDLLSLDAIEKAVFTLNQHPELDAVYMLVKTQYLDGRVKYFSSLDRMINDQSQFEFHSINGKDMFQKTVGKYDVHFRGLIRRDKFKAVSFRYQEKLVNGDEIVERLIFQNLSQVGVCSGVYEHFIYENSSAKSYNLKKTDLVRTDVILRSLFQKENVFEVRKHIFELGAYKTLVNGIKVFHALKNTLDKEEQEFYINRLKEGYNQLDKPNVLSNYKKGNKLYHRLLLSNFTILNLFYSIKKN